jgi:SNF2 family DNA or RNA helicase
VFNRHSYSKHTRRAIPTAQFYSSPNLNAQKYNYQKKTHYYKDWQEFADHVLYPFRRGEKRVYGVLKYILTPVLMRRLKKSRCVTGGGANVLDLPPMEVTNEIVVLNERERQFYEETLAKEKRRINSEIARGKMPYMVYFEALLRAR